MSPTPCAPLVLPTQQRPLRAADLLAKVTELGPVLCAGVPFAEQEGRLAPPVLTGLRDAGVLRMTHARDRGGLEADPLVQLAVVEEISRHDASAGWVAMIGSDGGYYSAFLEPAVAREVFDDVDDVVAGFISPAGRGRAHAPGWLSIEGKWPFASGSAHASLFASGILVDRRAADPEWRVAVVDADDVQILPTWDAVGLRGTSSHHYAGSGIALPRERTFAFGDRPHVDGPLYRFPGMFLVNVGGVPLGVGRAALDEVYRVLEDKVRLTQSAVRDEPRVHASLARAEGILGSARCLLHDAVGALWAALVEGDAPTLRQRANVWIATSQAFSAAREVVGICLEVAGSTACYVSSPLQRHLRDVTAMSAHVMAQPRTLETAGRMLLGQNPPVPVL